MAFPSLSAFLFSTFLLISAAAAAIFEIQNQCTHTVWAAANPGGGRRLDRGQTWKLNVTTSVSMARIWGRTNCQFDSSGHGRCLTGDCGGLLQCTGKGKPPNTLVEYALNQFHNLDFYDISLLQGFNIPIGFSPTNPKCRRIKCNANITRQCPPKLKVPGGCNDPCTVFNTSKYCCTAGPGACQPTEYSRFFKTRCPNAYSYPQDGLTSTFICPDRTTNYKVVFCPRGSGFDPEFPLEMVIDDQE